MGASPDATVVARAVEALDPLVERPYEGLVVHRGDDSWAAAARAIAAELVRLPGLSARSLELASTPDGERTVRVDDDREPLVLAPPVATALAELERRARARFETYVVAADRVQDDLWEVRVDPL
ncbi:MAG: hypothetical protein KY396_04680 [Actinobacteria bacterium]|nr:hypothetical protein [Actinomycetota bacterium]